jgi:hypothetical protein
MHPTQFVQPTQPRHATQRLQKAHAIHAMLPATASDIAVTILPATAALPAVAIDPATAVLATVAADPATPALATVAADPATAVLATVATDPTTAVLAAVASESTRPLSPLTDLTTAFILRQVRPAVLPLSTMQIAPCIAESSLARNPMVLATSATAVVEKVSHDDDDHGHGHGHHHHWKHLVTKHPWSIGRGCLRLLGVGAGRGQLARPLGLTALPNAAQCDTRHMTTGHAGQRGGSS